MIYPWILIVSILSLSCGDDRSSAQLQADQVSTSINDVNKSIDEMVKTYCTCSATTTGKDIQTCITENRGAPLELSECQKTATTCDNTSYVAFQNCQRDAYKTLTSCINTCPNSTAEKQCVSDFEANHENCNPLITTELKTAFQSCLSGQTPNCGSSPNPSTPKPDNNKCIPTDTFLAHFNKYAWRATYHAGSDGDIKCIDFEACISENLLFSQDNTYQSTWFSFPRYKSSSTNDMGQIVCTHGTWQLQCDQLTMTDCRGTTTSTIRLTNDGFKLDSRTFTEGAIFGDNTGLSCSSKPCR